MALAPRNANRSAAKNVLCSSAYGARSVFAACACSDQLSACRMESGRVHVGIREGGREADDMTFDGWVAWFHACVLFLGCGEL